MVLESASPGLPTEQERETRRAEDEALARGIEERGIEAWIDSWERSPLFAGRARLAPPERAAFLVQRRGNRAASLAATQAFTTGSAAADVVTSREAESVYPGERCVFAIDVPLQRARLPGMALASRARARAPRTR